MCEREKHTNTRQVLYKQTHTHTHPMSKRSILLSFVTLSPIFHVPLLEQPSRISLACLLQVGSLHASLSLLYPILVQPCSPRLHSAAWATMRQKRDERGQSESLSLSLAFTLIYFEARCFTDEAVKHRDSTLDQHVQQIHVHCSSCAATHQQASDHCASAD